jgi:ABC-type phosphate/phosphonate transport system substrate-binding protein
VDVNDAQAALEIWLNRVSRSQEMDLAPGVEVYHDGQALMTATVEGDLDAVSLLALEYLAIRDRAGLVPVMAGSSDGSASRTYLLLVRRDSGITGLDDLANRNLLVLTGGLGRLPRLWLDVVLRREGHPDSASHFLSVKEAGKASRTVLSVFFGQAHACVVPRRTFRTMAELNPQLADELVPLATSPELLWGITCFRAGFDKDRRETISRAALEMHTDPEGMQALMLFGLDRMVRIGPSDLESVERLAREHENLAAELGNGTTSGGAGRSGNGEGGKD